MSYRDTDHMIDRMPFVRQILGERKIIATRGGETATCLVLDDGTTIQWSHRVNCWVEQGVVMNDWGLGGRTGNYLVSVADLHKEAKIVGALKSREELLAERKCVQCKKGLPPEDFLKTWDFSVNEEMARHEDCKAAYSRSYLAARGMALGKKFGGHYDL